MDKNTPEDFSTLSIRGGQIDRGVDAHSEPLILSSSFRFDSAEQAAQRFSGQQAGNIYSRFTNPTVSLLQQRLALQEGGQAGRLYATGMAAVAAVMFSCLRPGDHVIAAYELFGTTNSLLSQFLPQWGVNVSRAQVTEVDDWRRQCTKSTRLFFLETPSNPQNRIADLAALAQLAEDQQCLLVVDNTTTTAALQRPLALGAHLSVLSLTKYFDGHGRVMGGACIGSDSLIEEKFHPYLRTLGSAISPFNAWMILQGIQTLKIRMFEHSRQALALAHWLSEQAWVERVFYPGLEDHPQHALAARQQLAYGALVSIMIRGDRASAFRFINGLQMISITANLGDAKTTVTHPATTTHHRLTPEQKDLCGITDNLVRFAVGLEAFDDIRSDISQAAHRLN